MRKTIVMSCMVLAAAIAVCLWSDAFIERAVSRADRARLQAMERSEDGDTAGAAEAVARLATGWREAAPLMEMLTSHEDIHRVQEAVVSARVLLRCGDSVGFAESMALLGESLEHIRRLETVSLANIF